MVTKAEVLATILSVADAERKAGGKVELNKYLGYCAVTTSSEEEYFFQGEDYDTLLAEVPENVQEEDYILYQSTTW